MFERRVGFSLAGAVAIAALGAGCVPSLAENAPREPRTELPKSYGEDGEKGAATTDWKAFFPDPHLQALIEESLTKNRELHMQLQELIIAKAEIMAAEGEYLPTLDVGVTGGIEKVGKHTSQGAADEMTGVPEHLPYLGFGFSASWEVDIWSKLRNSAKAAAKRYLAGIEGRRFAKTRLVAEIAHSYYELMALDNRLQVLERNVGIQEDALAMMRLQKEAARVTELAVQRFEAEVLKNQSRRFGIEQQITATENRINFLVGRPPQPVARSKQALKNVAPPVIDVGVPSELLENRPDVRRAELELEAAKLDVEAARAAFYPSFVIDGEIGYEAFNPAHLLDTPESLFYGLLGSVTAPLLNRQAIKAQYYAANAAQLQAVYGYEQAVLQAYTEVASQLAKIENLERSFELRAQQVEMLEKAVDVSGILFQSARADYMEVLMARREALEAELELIETREQQLHALVNVYQALGGGWR